MTSSDFVQNLIRILLWIGTPLLTKWGVDADSTLAILTGIGGFLGNAIWWFFWMRNKTPAAATTK